MYKIGTVKEVLDFTLEYLGKSVKSQFNTLYQCPLETIPNNSGEINLFLDPTGKTGLIDVQSNFIEDNEFYLTVPDLWIGETELFNQESFIDKKQIYNLSLMFHERIFFIVMRRIGEPSINYIVKNNPEKVYIMTVRDARTYYEDVVRLYGYQTLTPVIIEKEYVENNYFDFNVIK